MLNLVAVGSIFNISSTERALLAWGGFALVLAYRYSLRLLLAAGLLLLLSYATAAVTARMGYHWLEFYDRPEQFLLAGALIFALPFGLRHSHNSDFPPVYRLVGALAFFISVLFLSEAGQTSYFSWETSRVELFYGLAGLILSATAIWWGIARNWRAVVNTGAAFFIIFLFARLYHWWWDWMPRYLFFALIGAVSVALVVSFKRVRGILIRSENRAAA